MRRYWVVRMKVDEDENEYDDYEIGFKNHFVGIGWKPVGNLIELSRDKDMLKKKLKESYREHPSGWINTSAGQIIRFVNEVKIGDIVILPYYTPDDIIYYFGEVLSNVYYEEEPKDNAFSRTRVKVKWLAKVSIDDEIPEDVKRSIAYGRLTFFNVDKYGKYIEKLISENRIDEEDLKNGDSDNKNKIYEKLKELDPKTFENFIVELMKLEYPYEIVKSRYSKDGGIDFICLDEKLNIIYKGQIKSVSRPISRNDILILRGLLKNGQKGIYITLSSFTKDAIEEAKNPEYPEIELIGKDKILEMVSNHYEELSEDLKEKLK